MQVENEVRFLRQEILLRVAIQNFTLILLMPLLLWSLIAASLSGKDPAKIGLAYVGAAGMGALYWMHNGARMLQIRAYLHSVERAAGTAGWEAFLAESRVRGLFGSYWFISTKCVFVGSQLAAIIVFGPISSNYNTLEFGLAVGATMLTALLLIEPKVRGA